MSQQQKQDTRGAGDRRRHKPDIDTEIDTEQCWGSTDPDQCHMSPVTSAVITSTYTLGETDHLNVILTCLPFCSRILLEENVFTEAT